MHDDCSFPSTLTYFCQHAAACSTKSCHPSNGKGSVFPPWSMQGHHQYWLGTVQGAAYTRTPHTWAPHVGAHTSATHIWGPYMGSLRALAGLQEILPGVRRVELCCRSSTGVQQRNGSSRGHNLTQCSRSNSQSDTNKSQQNKNKTNKQTPTTILPWESTHFNQ